MSVSNRDVDTDSALFLVDASIYVFRAYFSLPTSLTDAEGRTNHAVGGFTRFLLDIADKRPGYVSVAFDESLNTCYRNDLYPAYKANRELPDDNLLYQFDRCREITDLLGFHFQNLKHYEADDIIGTLKARVGANRQSVIVSRDKDLGQLLGAGDYLWDFAADDWTDAQKVKDKFGVMPSQIADYLALAGDSVDNIPGAPGVGAKTAVTLLNHFGNIDALFDRLEEVEELGVRGAARIMKSLREHESQVRLYQSITQIHCEVPMDPEPQLEDLVQKSVSVQKLQQFAREQQLPATLTRRLNNYAESAQ